MKTYSELKRLFLSANEMFLSDDIDLFDSKVSERALCGALMIHLRRARSQATELALPCQVA